MLAREKLFLLSAGKATATVVGNNRHTYESNEYGTQHYYCSEFQFQTRDGQSISIEESDGNGSQGGCGDLDAPPDYQTGQQVPVYYDPHDPADTAQTPKAVGLNYNGGVIVLAAGVLCILLGLGFFWADLLRSRKAATSRAR